MSITRAMDMHDKHDGLPVMLDQDTTDVRYILGNKVLVKQYQCAICHEIITTHTVVHTAKKGKNNDSI